MKIRHHMQLAQFEYHVQWPCQCQEPQIGVVKFDTIAVKIWYQCCQFQDLPNGYIFYNYILAPRKNMMTYFFFLPIVITCTKQHFFFQVYAKMQTKHDVVLLAHNTEEQRFRSTNLPANTVFWDTKLCDQLPEHLPNQFAAIMICCPLPEFSTTAQEYICKQHVQNNVPLIFFPYPCSPTYELLVLEKYHPLRYENDQVWNTKVHKHPVLLQSHHPIVHGFTGSNLLDCHKGYRDCARPKQQTSVIATWHDGAPLISELNNAVCLNFSLSNAHDTSKLVQQTVNYLLKKIRRRNWKLFPICTIFADVVIVLN